MQPFRWAVVGAQILAYFLLLFSGGILAAFQRSGRLFGMTQATLLPWHRRLWWGLSALAWAFILALVLYFLNTSILLFSGFEFTIPD
ncbi:MAG: hypothetical protein EHM21_04185 [Chloroflexi bacterium]|nr:MAG: hypothetical protein EHM21_04185 [Chloroflexota bacterium]